MYILITCWAKAAFGSSELGVVNLHGNIVVFQSQMRRLVPFMVCA